MVVQPVSQVLPARPTGHEEAWRFTPVSRLGVLYDADLAADAVAYAVEGDHVAAGQGGVQVDVPARGEAAARVTVTGRGTAGAGRIGITVGDEATATVVVRYTGSASFASDVTVTTGAASSLSLVVVHDWAADSIHLDQLSVSVGRDARVHLVAVTLGGGLVRVDQRVTYAGPGGDAELSGLLAAGADQHLEHRSVVAHHEPNCKSRVLSKAVLAGEKAHTVWVGDVLIGATALGTDTYETNRNLVLVDGARADSVPNLEIETGEVTGAGHASATGRFDEQQLFYLRSRGIDEQTARRLVVGGFLAEVLEPIARLGLTELREELGTRLDAVLDVTA